MVPDEYAHYSVSDDEIAPESFLRFDSAATAEDSAELNPERLTFSPFCAPLLFTDFVVWE